VAGVLLARLALGRAVAAPRVRYAVIQPAAGWSAIPVFLGEAVSLAILMLAVVYFLTRHVLASWTPVLVGVAVASLIVAGGLTSGGSFNPARQFGPALFAHQWRYLAVYLVAPVVGGIALAAVRRLAGSPRPLTCALCGTTASVELDPAWRRHPKRCNRRQPWATTGTSGTGPWPTKCGACDPHVHRRPSPQQELRNRPSIGTTRYRFQTRHGPNTARAANNPGG
jgi:Major intrinsic protein